MTRNLLKAIVQVAAWAGFILLPSIIFNHPFGGPPPHNPGPPHMHGPETHSNWPMTLYCILLVAYYYLNFYVLIPKLFLEKKYLYYILTISVISVSIPPLPFVILSGQLHFGPFIYNSSVFLLFLLVTVVGLGIRITSEWNNASKQMQEAENEKVKNELAYLKSQINPHFLFNVLNNIYVLATLKSDKTADSIMSLSALMQYIIVDAEQDRVPIEREIQHIHNFIELQRMRLTYITTTSFNYNLPEGKFEIAPLLLLPFVENAFKYGVSTRESSTIDITSNITDGTLQFTVKNNKVAMHTDVITTNTGIGISNVKRRLELLYHDKYTLQIEDNDQHYSVELKIKLV
jgi:hypothetical protein